MNVAILAGNNLKQLSWMYRAGSNHNPPLFTSFRVTILKSLAMAIHNSRESQFLINDRSKIFIWSLH